MSFVPLWFPPLFLLERLHRATGGRSVTANVALLRANARLAAALAVVLAAP